MCEIMRHPKAGRSRLPSRASEPLGLASSSTGVSLEAIRGGGTLRVGERVAYWCETSRCELKSN